MTTRLSHIVFHWQTIMKTLTMTPKITRASWSIHPTRTTHHRWFKVCFFFSPLSFPHFPRRDRRLIHIVYIEYVYALHFFLVIFPVSLPSFIFPRLDRRSMHSVHIKCVCALIQGLCFRCFCPLFLFLGVTEDSFMMLRSDIFVRWFILFVWSPPFFFPRA